MVVVFERCYSLCPPTPPAHSYGHKRQRSTMEDAANRVACPELQNIQCLGSEILFGSDQRSTESDGEDAGTGQHKRDHADNDERGASADHHRLTNRAMAG